MHLFVFVVPEAYIWPLGKVENENKPKIGVKLNGNLKPGSLLAQFGFFGWDKVQLKHKNKPVDHLHHTRFRERFINIS